ncbi:LOW QUALITY PROTEIN: latent-transforming growth factor beta-binding protein 1 [Fundulus heteroclitus]|uniref:LOW QUALITY PROTEIN: latent-transforming growth factor beta-binding protein 1 n=1 Tax=Fundulus heteroclitus TaxID=8078 RepID=UPI00165B37D0|nr:LOW QUALITY PROTEIN: latent-transforming growth factor beta-binding protein 1 [Fundulus heteroclitus]
MRMWLLCLWTSWMLGAALQPPQREEGGVQPGDQPHMDPEGFRPGSRRQSRLQREESEPGEAAGKSGARRKAALSGPRVCGGRCCPGWTLSPKTRRCTKPRCAPPCRNGASCRLSNSCLCRKGFHGVRCQFSKVLLPGGGPPATSGLPTGQPASTTGRNPEPTDSGPKPPNDKDSGLLKSGSSADQSEGMDPGDGTGRFLTPKKNQASSGSTAPTRSDPDPERQRTVSEHVVLEAKAQTKGEHRNPHRPESLALKSSLGDKEEVAGASERRPEEMKWQTPSLREAQSVLLRNTLSPGGRGGNMAALLMKHITREKRKLRTMTSSYNSSSSVKTSMRTFHSQRGRYSVHRSLPKVLCPLLCKNGGVCLQKDRCLCPANFTGKFCQIPLTPSAAGPAAASPASPASTNEIVKPVHLSAAAANQELTQSEFLLPLGQNQEAPRSTDPRMVKVRVQHPPEASVKIHQVMKVSGSSPSLRTLSSSSSSSSSFSSSGSAGAPAPAPVPAAGGGIQAQTLRASGTYNLQSGFKYCFREVKDGQCSSPLPGLRSREVCCRGIGKAWGLTDCTLCPEIPGQSNSSCPVGLERINGSQCVDVNECLQPGLCENGICVNTRGSYSCVCRLGFILDATHGVCISQSVISEEKGQCYRVVGSGLGPSSCSLPIGRNITKQICCCSRVGKAWGPGCQRCPYFGSVAFKEICPAGPGYHYSASTLQFSQRADGAASSQGALKPLPDLTGSSRGGASSSQQRPASSGSSAAARPSPRQPEVRPAPQPQPSLTAGSSSSRPPQPAGSAAGASQDTLGPQQRRPNPLPARPQLPSTDNRAYQPPSGSRPDPPPGRGDSLQPPAPPQTSDRSRPGGELPSLERRPAVSPTSRPTRVQTVRGACESRPGVCGRGRCVDQPGGRHTCECHEGYQPNAQRSHCYDVDECLQNPCSYGHCENTPGSYRCVCRHGYRLIGNTCEDVDECVDPLRCPGQECVNTPGSYRCSSCQPGFGLLNGLCTDIDECRQSPCSNGPCENTPGSYRCVCRHGYRLHNNTCTDVDECEEPSQCPGQMCVNSVGSYRCVSCRPGYTLTNRQCTDVDECASAGACEAEQVCVNTVGSFRCDCRPGYRSSGLGRQCRDINECLEGDFCFSRGECVNTPGSYTCVCSLGFLLNENRTACLDVDECVRPGVCADGRCVNTEGSFECRCENGFTTNPERTACLDVDECVSSGGSVCASQRCENTIGSFRCLASCEAGYQVTADGSCVDEDECASQPAVCGSARCENTEGSFTCKCDGATDVFDSSARECVSPVRPASETLPDLRHSSSSSSSSSGFQTSTVDVVPVLTQLTAARPGELRECYYNLGDQGGCSLLTANVSQQECCCTMGEGWGLGCQYHTCPPGDTAEFLSLCPNGRGYVTSGSGAFSYTDVDECKRFQPEVCKNGVCVNNIPGYRCYCSSGFVYNSALLECVDYDECEEETCVGGVCVNTVGSYHCSCPPPMVLDDTQRNCVNASHLTVDENLSVCWQHVSADLLCQSPLLGGQVTFIDCCCLYGEGWGMGCALCPATDSDDYASLCSSYSAATYQSRFPDSAGPEAGPGRGAPPYSPEFFSPPVLPGRGFSGPDYDDYSPAGGSRSGFGGRTPGSFAPPDESYRGSEFSPGYYPEGDYGSPEGSLPRAPTFRLPPDPRADIAYGVRPLLPSRPDSPPLNLAPYEDREEEEEDVGTWRQGPPFPPFTDRSAEGGGGPPRRLYERRYETHAGLNAAEECGILHGCENGQCIRVAEGYTCDCYLGFELDMTSMTCIDINECEDSAGLQFPCVNARCVNTEGSFRCVCRRGYVMSRRRNHCIAA